MDRRVNCVGITDLILENGEKTNMRTTVVEVDELDEADRTLAVKFGYKPVFKREFDYLSTFSFAVSISSVFSTITLTFSYGLLAAGPASVIWTWLISGAGCLCVALSVAELVSAYPTCGGVYYTISRLVPEHQKRWIPLISWVTGWLNVLGQIAGIASSEFGSAQLLLAAISMGMDFTYVPTLPVTVGVMAGLLVVNGLINSLPTIWLKRLTKVYVMFHVAVLLTCSVALLSMTRNKHDAKYVFTHIDPVPLSGWSPVGFSFLFGALSVSYTMTGYDDTAHISESVKTPAITAPRAISSAMIFTYVVGFLFNIILCFCMGDPTEILMSPIAQPVAQIYFNSLGNFGGIFFVVCALVILQFGCFNAMQSLSSTIFAFSRDGLFPGSSIWIRIDRRTNTPLFAVWLSVGLCVMVNLIALGSLTAILGVFSVCAIALDWSYCIPIICKLWLVFFSSTTSTKSNSKSQSQPQPQTNSKFTNTTTKTSPQTTTFEKGPWNLGKYSTPINTWAILWTLFSSIIFVLPTIRPVTSTNMNHASAYLVGILVFAMAYWMLSARGWYVGPVVQVVPDLSDGSDVSDGSYVGLSDQLDM